METIPFSLNAEPLPAHLVHLLRCFAAQRREHSEQLAEQFVENLRSLCRLALYCLLVLQFRKPGSHALEVFPVEVVHAFSD